MSELLEQPDGATDSDTGNLSSQTRCDNLEDLPSKIIRFVCKGRKLVFLS